MAWEQGPRGGRYYVRKRWQDGRCVSEYIGGGTFAVALARVDQQARLQRAAVREERRREADLDAALDEVTEMASMLATAALLVSGCHTHKGQWRRRREQR